MLPIIPTSAIRQRKFWIRRIASLRGEFADVSLQLEDELKQEVRDNGYEVIINHLRLCGNIPESYKHDSSEEKQYSKYTDALLSVAFNSLGFRSTVITERADVADVDVYCDLHNYSFVADAKAFRLTRTAKNQKDFKVSSMDRWKHGKPFAMVVCPIYQLPTKTSQIYWDAISKDVIVLTYSHLAAIIRFSKIYKDQDVMSLMHDVFKVTQGLYPAKDAAYYWQGVNEVITSFHPGMNKIWEQEIIASNEIIRIGVQETIDYLRGKVEEIENLSREEAITMLIANSRLDAKMEFVSKIRGNHIMSM